MHPFTAHAIARQHQQDLLIDAAQGRRLRLARSVRRTRKAAVPRQGAVVRARPDRVLAPAGC